MREIFNLDYRFFKGNIHCHTTKSDGNYSPQEMVNLYEQEGYDFMMISDHEVYSNYTNKLETSLTLLPGYEASGKKKTRDKTSIYHLLIMAKTRADAMEHAERYPKFDDSSIESVQSFIDKWKYDEHVVILCHPHWSTIEYDEIKQLKGLLGIEVFNGSSHIRHNVGFSNVCFDALLREEVKVTAFATDDNHNSERTMLDSFQGWIMVNAKDNSVEEIVQAIIGGHYYSTMGPEFTWIKQVGHFVEVRFNKANRIYLHEQSRRGQFKILETEDDNAVVFELNGDEEYIRFELVDSNEKRAWSNPIYMKDN